MQYWNILSPVWVVKMSKVISIYFITQTMWVYVYESPQTNFFHKYVLLIREPVSIWYFNHLFGYWGCWWQTFWTQIRAERRTLVLIWIQNIWKSEGVPERIFQRKQGFREIQQTIKGMQNSSVSKVLNLTWWKVIMIKLISIYHIDVNINIKTSIWSSKFLL